MDLSQSSRTKLIGQIAGMLREPTVPDEARAAGLELICWLARRMPHDRVDATMTVCCRRRVVRSGGLPGRLR